MKKITHIWKMWKEQIVREIRIRDLPMVSELSRRGGPSTMIDNSSWSLC